MAKIKAYYLTGKMFWTKVLGEPEDNFDGDAREWSFDLALDEKNIGIAESLGLGPKIKDKSDDRGKFIHFTRSEFKKSGEKIGEPNEPIEVTTGEYDWDRSVLIGNGTFAQVKFSTYDSKYKSKTFRGAAVLSVDIIDHVIYEAPKRAVRKKHTEKTTEDWSNTSE